MGREIEGLGRELGRGNEEIVKYEGKIMSLRAKEQMTLKSIGEETEKFRRFLS